MESTIQAFGWPHAALVFGMFFLFLFRKEVSTFLLKVKRVGKDGLHAEEPVTAQTNVELSSTDLLEHMDVGKSVFLDETEKLIFDDLKSRSLDTASQTTHVLVRNLAMSYVNLSHEQNYSAILGSQIKLLRQINGAAGQGVSDEYMEEFYAWASSQYSKEYEGWNTEKYLAFLINAKLIVFQNDLYYITNKGVDFLVWIAKSGRSDDRSY